MQRSFWRGSLALMLAVIVLSAGRRPASIHQVNTTDGDKLIHEVGAFLVDVRTPAEFEKGYIPGATLIPLAELSKRLKELPADKTQPILVYCATGARSQIAAKQLRQSGRKDIYNLSGGLRAWTAAQKPIQIPKGK